jgi:hypothetical protein
MIIASASQKALTLSSSVYLRFYNTSFEKQCNSVTVCGDVVTVCGQDAELFALKRLFALLQYAI